MAGVQRACGCATICSGETPVPDGADLDDHGRKPPSRAVCILAIRQIPPENQIRSLVFIFREGWLADLLP